MKLQGTERGRTLELSVGEDSGNGWRRMNVKRAGSVVLKLVMLVVLVAAGVWAFRANLSSDRPAMDMSMRVTSGNTPFPVSVAPVERGSIVGTVVYTGSVAPFNEEDVYPRVTGRIVEMLVYPGDAVRPGQVVARLDSVELSSRVGEAEAGLVTAQASRAQMEADLTAARYAIVQMEKELAMVDAELTYSRSLIARTERLFNTGGVSRQEYESDRAMAASTEAKREAAQAKLEQARASETGARRKLEAADSMVSQARASLRTATIVRDYVEIVAPSSGYVVKRLVAPGVLVQPGMAILKIAQIDRVRLQANVGEKDVASIRVGSPVTVTTTVPGQPPITARVTAVFPFVDQGPANGGRGGSRGECRAPVPAGPVRDHAVRDGRAPGCADRPRPGCHAHGREGDGVGGEGRSRRAPDGGHGARRSRARGDRPGTHGRRGASHRPRPRGPLCGRSCQRRLGRRDGVSGHTGFSSDDAGYARDAGHEGRGTACPADTTRSAKEGGTTWRPHD